jgi:GNAT superfamily N-acetyltransferase
MFAQEPPPDFDVPGRREPGERPKLVAEVGLVEVACATGKVAPVDQSGGVDRRSPPRATRPKERAGWLFWAIKPRDAFPTPHGVCPCANVARWGTPIEFKRLARVELSSVAEIDRTERIDLIYEQRGTELQERRGNWNSLAWDSHGHGEHSVEAQRHALERYVDAGGITLGAFSNGRLVGIGVIVPHLRPEIAQLAFLHVSEAFRATGIGRRLSDELDLIARDAGDTEIVVSATPSENTVRFYISRGYELMAQALPELYELEPEDVHMRKAL